MKPDLGKLLYPRLPPDQRRRELRVLLAALLTGLVIPAAIAVVIFESDKRRLF